jgi:hypothetical protein
MERPVLYELLRLWRPVTASFIESLDARSVGGEITFSAARYTVGGSYRRAHAQYQGFVNASASIFGSIFVSPEWSLDVTLGRSGDLYVDRQDRTGFLSIGATYDIF